MKAHRPGDIRDFSRGLDLLCRELCRKLPELAHIDPDRVLFCLSRSRAEGTHGLYARIAPLRFEAGEREASRRRGRYRETFRMPSIEHQGREILYLIYLLVPRFLRLSRRQQLVTVVHELYHISERFDGDIRRFAGRNYAHGASRRGFNRQVEALVDRYLEAHDPALLAFLDGDEESWRRGEWRLTGLRISLPRARLVARERLK